MAAPKGNSYYKLAVGFKKPRLYMPAALWKKAVEYAKWVETNPLKSEKIFSNGKKQKETKLRAMSLQGFCIFACMAKQTFLDYEGTEGYVDICARIRDLFFMQKFEGAAADLLNHAIISRELNLADKTELSGPDGKAVELKSEVDPSKLDDDTLMKLFKARKSNNDGDAATENTQD